MSEDIALQQLLYEEKPSTLKGDQPRIEDEAMLLLLPDRIEQHIGDCHIKSFNGPNCMEGGIGFFCGNGRTIIIIEFQMASRSSTAAVSSFDRKSSRLRSTYIVCVEVLYM